MRVLLVEDDELVRGLTSLILRGLGHEVVEAGSARAALELVAASDQPADVLFTDVRLGGGIDGIELARQSQAQMPALGIVLTSGDPSSLRTAGLRADRVQVIAKPYRKDQIKSAMDALAPSDGH